MKSHLLSIYKALHKRMDFNKELSSQFERLIRGYDGEKLFFEWLSEKLDPSVIIVNNLLLSVNDSELQIDSLLVIGNDIYLFEVKNYYGDYVVRGENWYNVRTQKEIRNPLLQLNRSRYLFQKILHQESLNFNLHTYLIFINSEFTLYMPEPDSKLILPTQLNRFLTHLSNRPFKQGNAHTQLMNFFKVNRLTKSKYDTIPEYHFNQLKKGVTCKYCHQFVVRYDHFNFKCLACRKVIKIDILLCQMIDDFQILFPHKKLTVSVIYEWCDKIVSKKPITKILKRSYKQVGRSRNTYYIPK